VLKPGVVARAADAQRQGIGNHNSEANMSDTTPEAAAVQIAVQRGLTPAQRLRTAFEMSLLARALCLTRLRRQHPEWTEGELQREMLRYAFSLTLLPPPLR
jgi:hypothetical protein